MKRLTFIMALMALLAGCSIGHSPPFDPDSRNFAALPAPPRAAPAPPPPPAPAAMPPTYQAGQRPGIYYFQGPDVDSMPPSNAGKQEHERVEISGGGKPPRKMARAPTPAPTPALDQNSPLPVNSADEAMKTWPFLGQLKKADIAFNTPKQIELGSEATLQLIIDPTKTSEEIKQAITAEGAKFGATVHVSKVVVAKLLAPDFDVIQLVNKGKQAIDFNGPTEWRWIITPKKEGSHKIHLTISAVVEVGTDKAERFIKSFEHEITVIVTPTNRVKGLLEKHWQWAFSSLLVPLGVWLWKRRKEKQS